MLEVSLRLAISMKVKAVLPLEVMFLLLGFREFVYIESASLNKSVPNRFLFFDGPLSDGRGLCPTSTEFLNNAILESVPTPISQEVYESFRADIV